MKAKINIWQSPILTFRVCADLAPRPMTVVFGLGVKLCLRMHIRLQLEWHPMQ